MDPFYIYGPTYVSACESIVGVLGGEHAASQQAIVV